MDINNDTISKEQIKSNQQGNDKNTQKEKYLIFKLMQKYYGIPLSSVKEVIGLTDITEIPNVPKYFKGLINLRGKIISVLDLRAKLNLPKTEYEEKKTNVGKENINATIKIIQSYGLSISCQEVGGALGRKIEFNTKNGEIRFKLIKSSNNSLQKKDLKLLIIDDSKPVRLLLKKLFVESKQFKEIVEAKDAFEASEIRRNKKFDVITLDINMPKKDGVSYLKEYDSLFPFRVKEAEDGDLIQSNTVYIAPGGRQMKVRDKQHSLYIQTTDDPPVNRFKPSVDYLFNSLSEYSNKAIIGILLTGMGSDGALGLKLLQIKGAHTIVQDEKTSIVFGMPKAAIENNAADNVLPLNEISTKTLHIINSKTFNKKKAS